MAYTIDLAPFPHDLSRLRILITNDDGIHAHGLRVLLEIAQTISQDVWVVAPAVEQSGASHSVTINRPVRYQKIAEKRYVVDGTPTDCVLMACAEIMRGQKPHLVLSGVNHGQNMGDGITYSGTVSAAIEGTLMGVPSIAFSAYDVGANFRWDTVQHHGPALMQKLLRLTWSRGVLMNVNFPGCAPDEVAGIQPAAQGFPDVEDIQLLGAKDPYGRQFFWMGGGGQQASPPVGTDVAYISQNYITLTPLHLDMTHAAMLKRLKDNFKKEDFAA